MTKKDYVLVARAFKATKPYDKGFYALDVWDASVREVAKAMKADNPRFDKDKFVLACYQ